MKNRLFMIFEIVIFVAYIFATVAMAETQRNERPITIKGLSIGMDVNEARIICEKLLGKNWLVSPIDNRNKLMDDFKESRRNDWLPIVGERGFLIKNKDGYSGGYGFISDDDGNGRVEQMTFSGELTDYIYSSKEVHADDFVEQFTKHFGLRKLPWIWHGWTYSSPYGYTLTIMIDKSFDIKKIDPGKPIKPKGKIKFD